MSKFQDFKRQLLDAVFPPKLAWVAGKAGAVDTASDAQNARGEFTPAMSNYIRSEVAQMLGDDDCADIPYHIVRVDGKSQLPRGLEDGEFCVVVKTDPSKLKPNDVVVLHLDQTGDNCPDISFKFRAVDSYEPNGKILNTYRYDAKNGDKIKSRAHSADLLLGKVHSRVQFF